MKIPCKDCLVLAVCRNKTYTKLVFGCSVLDKMLYRSRPGMLRTSVNRNIDFGRILVEVDRLMGTNHWHGLNSTIRRGKRHDSM